MLPPARSRRTVDDRVDEAVLLRLFGGEPAVAVRVGLDALDGWPVWKAIRSASIRFM